MKKRRATKLLALALLLSACIAAQALGSASVDAATSNIITSFDADETLSRNDPQGTLHIVERITVSFNDTSHGILRAIPSSYKSHELQMKVNGVSSNTGAPSQYTTYASNGNTVLKIGSPDQTVTGSQEYTLDYTLNNVISFYKDHDELYWDVNGDQWDQDIQMVSVTVHTPDSLQQSGQPLCFAGSYGATAQTCAITSSGNTFKADTLSPLSNHRTLTYVAGFQKGYFAPSTGLQTLGERLVPLLKFFVPLILIGGGSVLYWYRKGRDAKGTGIIVPQYSAPDGLKPIAVGTIIDFKVDNRDFTATILDLAVRRYIKIIESEHAKLLRKDTTSYNLELTNADFSLLDSTEKTLMGALFNGAAIGTIIDVTALKTKLSDAADTLRGNVTTDLTTAGYFKSNPLSASSSLIGIIVVIGLVIWIGGKFFGPALIAGLVIGGLIALICTRYMGALTAKGVAAKEQIEGLRMYLNVAEKDRIQKQQAPSAQYAPNAGEPVRTVELFEKLLPYAMVLGVEKQWATKFEGLYTTPPDWYSGNWATFNAFYLASSLNDGIGSAVNQAFTAPSSSGSSGFGGGGFSGGGGGGGGGGTW